MVLAGQKLGAVAKSRWMQSKGAGQEMRRSGESSGLSLESVHMAPIRRFRVVELMSKLQKLSMTFRSGPRRAALRNRVRVSIGDHTTTNSTGIARNSSEDTSESFLQM